MNLLPEGNGSDKPGFVDLITSKIAKITALVAGVSGLLLLLISSSTQITQKAKVLYHEIVVTTEPCLVINPPKVPSKTFPMSKLGSLPLELIGNNKCSGSRTIYLALIRNNTTGNGEPPLAIEVPHPDPKGCEGAPNIHNPDCWMTHHVDPGPWSWPVPPCLTPVGTPTKDHPLVVSIQWYLYDADKARGDTESSLLDVGDSQFTVVPD